MPEFLYGLLILLFCFVLISFSLGMLRPKLSGLQKISNHELSRKKILKLTTPVLFVCFIAIGFFEPASVKEDRLLRESEAAATRTQSEGNKGDNSVLQSQSTKNITYKNEDSIEKIPFSKEEKEDPQLANGTRKVTRNGVLGEKTITYKISYVDGVQTAKEQIGEKITLEPVSEITSIGTYVQPVPRQPTQQAPVQSSQSVSSYYRNCTAAREAGVTPLYAGQPGYGSHLDRDNDGVACE